MCVLRSQADRARSGGPRRHHARRHHVHRHLPRLRHPHRRQRSPASSSLAPRSSAPRSSALSSLAGTSLVGASLVDASLAGASLAGASLGSQHLYLFWRQTAGARRGTRRLARGCASAREVRERARGCVSAREDARARGDGRCWARDVLGFVARTPPKGGGPNMFCVRRGVLRTPPRLLSSISLLSTPLRRGPKLSVRIPSDRLR